MTRLNERGCPDPELLAAFAEGHLSGAARETVVEHLAECDACAADVALAMRAMNEEATIRKPGTVHVLPWGLALAAAALIAVVTVPLLRRDTSQVARLVAAAPRSARLVEPRLTGGFAWARYRGSARSTGTGVDAEALELAGEAGALVKRADAERSADAQHAAGIAMVLIEQPAEAVRRLELAALRKNDAAAWSDLAAARYAAAASAGRASLYPQALAAADTALRSDPAHPEALFNRALILERMGLSGEARKAWLRYLEIDPGSPWATEARGRLRDLPATPSSMFERDRPLLETAAAAHDQRRVRELVALYPQQARTWAEGEYLARWGEATRRGDAASAERSLALAREIGAAVQAHSGESLLADAVAAIDASSAGARAAMAEAHVLYREGRIAYSRQASARAEEELRRAATRFGEAHHPMALLARYYAAGARLQQNDVEGARRELAEIASSAPPRFIALGAAARWELARAHIAADDWHNALPVLAAGAALYRRLGERSGEAFLESMAAGTLITLGRHDESWDARIRAFRALSAEGDADLLARSVLGAVDAELRAGRKDAALALSSIARAVAGAEARPIVVVDALLQKATLEASMEQPVNARASADEAERVARSIPDEALRARALADVAVARAHAMSDSDPRAATDALGRAIELYRERGVRHALPEALLLRAQCALRLHDVEAARRDLEEGMHAAEQRRDAPGQGLPATGAMAADRSLFAEAIRLALDERNPAAAFAYAERLRGGSVDVATLQRRLGGSNEAVLTVIALPKELVTIAVTGGGVTAVRSAISEERANALARASSGNEALAALTLLYDAIVRPLGATLAGADRVIVVADPLLEGVPFAALYDRDTRRYLVQRFAVASASSASSLRGGAAGVPHRALVVGLPSGEATKGLPESEREVNDIARLYTRAVTIAPPEATWSAVTRAAGDADVVHIAGHAERQQGAGDSALLFAGERVSWKSIGSARRIEAEVVVLAACETLRRPASANTRALTLGEAFAAAGARDVAGTLVPVADRDARELFQAFHQHLASGDYDAVGALRRVQLDSIRGEAPRDLPAWAGLAVLTTRISKENDDGFS